MAEKELFDGLIKTIKPEKCDGCHYNAEIYKNNRIAYECSQKKCIFEDIAVQVLKYLEDNYKVKKL